MRDSPETYPSTFKLYDVVVTVVGGALSAFLAWELFGSREQITSAQTVPIIVMILGISQVIFNISLLTFKSTSIVFYDKEFRLKVLWQTKLVRYSDVRSLRLLAVPRANGFFVRKAVCVYLKNGSKVVIPNCFRIAKSEIYSKLEARMYESAPA